MNLIKYGVLALSLVLVTACGQKEEAATPAEPATAAAPAPEPAPAQEAAPAAMDNAATPVPAEGSPLATEEATAAAACPTGCRLMSCPPPTGPTTCCKQTSTGYKQC